MSDYEISDEDEYYDEEMLDGTQEEASDADDDVDMDDFGDDFKPSTSAKRKAYEIEYESLSQSAVEKLMQQDIDHVCGILGVDTNYAVLLLRHLSWNKERLIEKYMDNPSALLVAAGITPQAEPPSTPKPIRSHQSASTPTNRRATRSTSRILSSIVSPSKSSQKSPNVSPLSPAQTPKYVKQQVTKSSDEPFVCPICFDDAPDLIPLSLDCEHLACSGCWTAYLSSKINDESEHCIRCMAEGCALVASDAFIQSILLPEGDTPAPSAAERKANAATWARFHELTIRHFVASNSSLKYCPYPGCTNTVSCPSAASKAILTTVVPTVSCGARGVISDQPPKASQSSKESSILAKEHKFCFGCPIDSDHQPVICVIAKMWLKKCRDDSETANWIKSNTKECAQCQSTIEKNGGCNHMTCKKCKHEFCWVCMGPWSEHGTQWYSCNRYDEKGGVDARDAQSKSRASLERYLHYYNRWANHEQSAKLSVDLYSKTEKKMEDMQITSSLTWIEVQFMKKAVEVVDKCRQTLKWTYAMAYYLAKGNQKELFEDNQRDLEKAVEDLSELLEGPIDPDTIGVLRQKVTDKTVYVQNRNEIVLEDTAKGFLEGRWKWNIQVDGFEDEPDNYIV